MAAERLDHPADAVGDLGRLLGCLTAVELDRLDPGSMGDLDHAPGQFVAEHADGEDLGWQAAGDVVHLLRGDLAG